MSAGRVPPRPSEAWREAGEAGRVPPSSFDRGAVARAIAAAVTSVPGVGGLHPGRGVEVATHYAGGKVVGVEIGARLLRVHVVLDGLPVAPVVRHVHEVTGTVLRAVSRPLPVEVVVQDVDSRGLRPAARDTPDGQVAG